MTKLATWNINSVRLRLPLISKFVQDHNPDIICLQETKVMDDLFPLDALKSLGYPHILFAGQKSYNGVAILSKLPLKPADNMHMTGLDDKRHIAALLPNGAVLHNFYVPAGGDIPDPKANPKFDHKLRFIDHMHDWSKEFGKQAPPMILVGDLNIAPHEHDVWSHKQMLKVVSHTPVETEALLGLQKTADWIDTARHFVPHSEKLYSWWSYRASDPLGADRGRRLDHIWVTPKLKDTLIGIETLRHVRGWEGPSDHVPVILEMKI